jgi:beta-glucosidase
MSNKFPQDFLWGAASSSHQIEENKDNDWTEWEQQNSEKLAQNAIKKYERLKYASNIMESARTPLNYLSEKGTLGIQNFDVDLQMMQELNLSSYRFSVEWSRIEPKPGEYNYEAVETYRDMIEKLIDSGIEPMLTTWHFTNPRWIANQGGWLNEETVDRYLSFLKFILSEFGENITYWITLNEPNVYSRLVYLTGQWLSEETSFRNLWTCMDNFLTAHRNAYKLIHKKLEGAKVSSSFNLTDVDFSFPLPFKGAFRKLGREIFNDYYLNQFTDTFDFIAVNHYHKSTLGLRGFSLNHNAEEESDLGWGLYPESMYTILKDLKGYDLPVIITESGIADAADTRRGKFISETLKYVRRAIDEGVDVRGYYYFSLTDNFEWADGFFPRFGLIEIDNEYERKIRNSAYTYRGIINETNA